MVRKGRTRAGRSRNEVVVVPMIIVMAVILDLEEQPMAHLRLRRLQELNGRLEENLDRPCVEPTWLSGLSSTTATKPATTCSRDPVAGGQATGLFQSEDRSFWCGLSTLDEPHTQQDHYIMKAAGAEPNLQRRTRRCSQSRRPRRASFSHSTAPSMDISGTFSGEGTMTANCSGLRGPPTRKTGAGQDATSRAPRRLWSE